MSIVSLFKFGLSTFLLKELNEFLMLTPVCLDFRFTSSNLNNLLDFHQLQTI